MSSFWRYLDRCAVGLVCLLLSTVSVAKAWRFLPEHAQVSFELNLLGGLSPQGAFTVFSGVMEYAPENQANTSLAMKIHTQSVQIDVPRQLHALAEGDFFNTHQFPYLLMQSKRIRFYAKHKAKIIAHVTFMGKTEPLLLDATIKPMRKGRVLYVDAATVIKRSDFGVTLPVVGVADEIPVKISGYLVASKTP